MSDPEDCSLLPAPCSLPPRGPVFEAVHADLEERNRKGRETYGGELRPHNGRDPLREAYEEALDLCVYLRWALMERASE